MPKRRRGAAAAAAVEFSDEEEQEGNDVSPPPKRRNGLDQSSAGICFERLLVITDVDHMEDPSGKIGKCEYGCTGLRA